MASKMILVHEERKEFKVFKLYSWMMMYKDITIITIFVLPLYILVIPYAIFCRIYISNQRKRMLVYIRDGFRLDTNDYNSEYIYVQWMALPLDFDKYCVDSEQKQKSIKQSNVSKMQADPKSLNKTNLKSSSKNSKK